MAFDRVIWLAIGAVLTYFLIQILIHFVIQLFSLILPMLRMKAAASKK